MNKSKKIKSGKQVVPQVKTKEKLINPKVLQITSIVLVVFLVGALLFDSFYKETYLTIDDEKYKMDDLSYYFYEVESAYSYYDQLFGGGGAYWNMTFDETTGETVRDAAKDDVMEQALRTEILYNDAVADGYTLSDEEKTSVETNVTQLLDNQLTKAEIKKNGFTKEVLTKFVSKSALVDRYRQDIIDSFEIDDAAIKESISYEENRQYDIEYLFASTKTTDEDGNAVDKSEEEIAAASEKMNTLYESAKASEDWSTLLEEEEKVAVYTEDSFIESDTKYDDDFEAVIMAMENGAIGDIYETEKGFYVVRMINNNSSETYDSTVEEAIRAAENEAFTAYYSDVLDKHEYSVNENALKNLTMGSVTLEK